MPRGLQTAERNARVWGQGLDRRGVGVWEDRPESQGAFLALACAERACGESARWELGWKSKFSGPTCFLKAPREGSDSSLEVSHLLITGVAGIPEVPTFHFPEANHL